MHAPRWMRFFAGPERAVIAAALLLLGWVAVWSLLSRFVPQRQFLHDQLAGTRLIDTRPA